MKYYLGLQWRMWCRHMVAFGLSPWVVVIIAPVLFWVGSEYIWRKLAAPQYIYSSIGVLVAWTATTEKRNEFISTIFTQSDYTVLRMVEHVIMLLPFSIFLCAKSQYICAASILVIGMMMHMHIGRSWTWPTVPTPFGRYPYEMTVGFRRSWWLILSMYALIAWGLWIHNHNLSLFGLMVIGLITSTYYLYTEPVYFVWIHAMKEDRFITHKLSVGMWYQAWLVWPAAFLLLALAPDIRWLCIGVMIGSALYLATCMLVKYTCYPMEVNLVYSFLLMICLFIPPMMLIALPFIYQRARYKLNHILI
jgi:predicted histidine transporter YuiF (NhaC family)